MIDFERFWQKGNSPYADEEPDDAEDPPGVTAEEIRAWEGEHGVTLPEPIRTALGIRNGGSVRNTSIEILPLDQIVPADDTFWEWTEIGEDEAPDHALMFVFGHENEVGGTFLMNFNANGPGSPPSVYIDHHGESTYLFSDTIGELFESALAASDVPEVNWSEGAEDLPIVARETVDLSAPRGDGSAMDQVLAREAEALVLFTRQRSPWGEVLTRTTLPLPLDAASAQVGPLRPAPNATFALHLQPAESAGIVQVRSETNDDGRWKNTVAQGVPIYVNFESTDRDRLRGLRAQLLGDEGAARAQAGEDRQSALETTLGALTPEQRTAAMLQAALNMRAEAEREAGDLGPVPPELAGAAEAMRRKLEEMAETIRQKAAANPPDPEAVRRIEGLLRGPDTE